MRDIDAVIDQLRHAYPDISAEQLAVRHHGADDDGLWLFHHPASDVEFQLESSAGACPFLAESSVLVGQLTADTIEQAVALVIAGLGLADQRPNNSFKPNPLRGSA